SGAAKRAVFIVRSAAGMSWFSCLFSPAGAFRSSCGEAGSRFMANCPSEGAGWYVMMKKVKSWNAMSSMGVIWSSTSSCFDFRNMAGSTPFVHGLQGELLEPLGLAGGDDAEELRVGRVAVGADNQDRRQRLARLGLLARSDLDVQPHQLGLVLDLADGPLGVEALAVEQQVSVAIDVQHEPVFDRRRPIERPRRTG